MLIKNAKIYTMEEEGIIEGDILIQDGKIVKVGNVEESDDEVIEDLLFAILFNVKCEHSSPFDALEFINKFSVQLDVNKKKFPEFIRLYCETRSSTVSPRTNGFREPEMRQTAVILTLRISKRNCPKKAA